MPKPPPHLCRASIAPKAAQPFLAQLRAQHCGSRMEEHLGMAARGEFSAAPRVCPKHHFMCPAIPIFTSRGARAVLCTGAVMDTGMLPSCWSLKSWSDEQFLAFGSGAPSTAARAAHIFQAQLQQHVALVHAGKTESCSKKGQKVGKKKGRKEKSLWFCNKPVCVCVTL